jgi:fibronectin-binding autotransporter adhesin
MKRPRSSKLISRACLFAAAALLTVGAPPSARAANLFFDQNGATAGTGATGAAAWDTTSSYWVNASAPSPIVASVSGTTINGVGTAAAYTFTSADVAYFMGGSVATITLGTASVTASGGASGQAVITTTNTTGLAIGMTVTGTGIPAGATITAITANTNFTISANLTAVASGTVAAAQLVTLNGINDSVGETFAGSTLTLAGTAPTISVANGKTTTIASILAGTVGMVSDGSGTLKLTGANTYTGTTNLKDGVLSLDFSASTPTTNILAAAGTLTLSGGSLTLTGKASTTNSQTFASTALANGNATLTLTANATANPLLLSLGAITRSAGATMNIVNPTGAISATNGVVFSNAAVNGIIPWATIGGADFSGVATAGATAMTTYTALLAAATSATTNYNLTANLTQSASQTVNALKIAPAAATTLTLGTTTLTIGTGGLLMTGATAANSATISGSGTNLTAGNTSGTYDLIVQQWSAAPLNITAVIGNNGANAVSLTKAGTGTLNLSGINTFTGNTFVNGGTLILSGTGGGAGAIRNNVTVNPGATLELAASNILGYTAGTKVNVLTINRGTVKTSTYSTAGDQGWGLSIGMTGGTLQSNAGTASATATQYYSLGGGSSITTYASDLSSTISGRVNLRDGNANNQLVFNVADGVAATDLLVSAMITQSATFGIKKTGAGLMSITGQTNVTTANTFYSGSTLISGGILSVPGDGASVSTGYYLGQLPASAFNVVVSGTATAGASGQATITVPSTTGMQVGQLVTGTGVVDGSTITAVTSATVITISNNLTAAFAGAYTTWGNLTLEGNGLLQFTATGTLAANRGVGLKGNGGFDAPTGVVMTVAGVVAGTGQLLKSNVGSVILSGTNTYTGGTSILGGTLQVAADANLGATGGLTFDNTARTANTATLLNTASYTFSRTTTLTSSGTFSNNSGVTFTNSGAISGSGALTVTGAGVTLLSGGNSYTGGTTINGTTLRVSADNNLGTTGGLTFSSAGTLNTTGSFTFARTVALGANATFDITAGTALTISGVVSGTSNLTKTTTGELILSGANTYSGTTTISAGTITINTDTSLGATPGTATVGKLAIANTAALRSSANVTVSANRGVTLSGATGLFRAASGSTLTYGGTFALGGATGTLQVGGDTLTGGTVELLATTVLPTGMNIEIISSGALKASGLYADANTWLASGKLATTSTGTLALTGNSAAAIDLTNFPLLGIGAAVDSVYTGSITPGVSTIPGATGYYLGGGGAKLTVSTALTGTNNLVLGGYNSTTGTVVLNSANTYTLSLIHI